MASYLQAGLGDDDQDDDDMDASFTVPDCAICYSTLGPPTIDEQQSQQDDESQQHLKAVVVCGHVFHNDCHFGTLHYTVSINGSILIKSGIIKHNVLSVEASFVVQKL